VIGIGLAAACGFRVFVPLLILNLAALSGQLVLPSGFAWLGSTYVTIAFATATAAEVLGYYIPWLDHVLDVIATPAAVIAGTVTMAAVVTDVSPFLKWTMALIGGGGMAGLVQASTVALRAKTSLATAGTGNPFFATLELTGSLVAALLAIFLPLVCLILIVIFCAWVLQKATRLFLGRSKTRESKG
jgi:hypothetical protein